jgi:hypothetical protein
MTLVENRFGIRKEPKWARNDFEAHVRLASELKVALSNLQKQSVISIPEEFSDIEWNLSEFNTLTQKEKMLYFFDYALRLQRCYVFYMDAMSPYCRVRVKTTEKGGYLVNVQIEDKQYSCNYLYDYVCCLSWIVSRINYHIQNKAQKKV